jgi:hypothetical protein
MSHLQIMLWLCLGAYAMHLFPFLLKRGRFSPGLFTTVLLFWPLGVCAMMAAPLTIGVVVTAFAVGAALLATPIGLVLLKEKRYFDRPVPIDCVVWIQVEACAKVVVVNRYPAFS